LDLADGREVVLDIPVSNTAYFQSLVLVCNASRGSVSMSIAVPSGSPPRQRDVVLGAATQHHYAARFTPAAKLDAVMLFSTACQLWPASLGCVQRSRLKTARSVV